ncbi:hypothetical protein RM192_16055, partial [Novosphingobium sp. MMS21-SN21R]|nr:hypothetical protein [Novosphingobium sp. MMS21-SN21R]
YPDSELPGSPTSACVAANFTGPTSTTLRFTVGSARIWGVGFLPLGWARFLNVQANRYADRIFAVDTEPFLESFGRLHAGSLARPRMKLPNCNGLPITFRVLSIPAARETIRVSLRSMPH